jgi:hypothetical protein
MPEFQIDMSLQVPAEVQSPVTLCVRLTAILGFLEVERLTYALAADGF